MFKIYDGRTDFYQWDLDRKLIVSDPTINEVHFCNKTGDCSLVVEVYEEDGLRLANVPNILLQTDWPIRVYGFCGDCYTKISATFKIIARTRPADYIYTETDVKKILAQTLEGNEEDKAPSVKAVNDGLALKAEKTDVETLKSRTETFGARTEALETDVETLEKDVAELNFIIGTQYEIKKLENDKPVKVVPSKAVGTQIFFNRIEPTYYFGGLTESGIITGNKIANAYSVGDYEDYSSDAFSVAVNSDGTSLTINTLDVDCTYNEVIDVHFDSVEVKAGEPIFLSYRVVSGSYTPTGDEPRLYLRLGEKSLRLPISSTRTPDDGFRYYVTSSPSNTTISSFSVDLSDEVAFNNFVIDVSIGCDIGESWIYPKFPYYLGGKYLGEIEKFARNKNARLDRGYFNRETFEIAYNYVDMDTRELVIKCEQTVDGATEPCEERRVSIDEILTNMDFDGFIEASAGNKITFEASDYNIYYNHSVFSYVVSTLGG